jgi:Ca2+-binding RTX toxin-like protein
LLTAAPVGVEFQVNLNDVSSVTNHDGQGGNVAMDSAGDFVVTWEKVSPDGSSVYAQKYDASGLAIGQEILVADGAASPTVAMDATGDFVVAYRVGTGNYEVYAQRYDAAGVAQGAGILVADASWRPTVAMDATGDFVVAYVRVDGTEGQVYAQQYNSAGEPSPDPISVGVGSQATVAMDATGDFVVVLSGYGDVTAQRYNAAGQALGDGATSDPLLVGTTGIAYFATVAMDSAGDFVITWTDFLQDGTRTGVAARRYDATGKALGEAFVVNNTLANDQWYSTVAMDSTGGFVVSWTSDLEDRIHGDIYARQYDAAGIAQTNEFLVNTTTVAIQHFSTVAMDSTGDFVVVWNDLSTTSDPDAGYMNVKAQRFHSDTHLNAAPVLSNMEATALAYAPNDAATPVTSTLNLVDLDSLIAGATIQISGGYQPGDVLAFNDTAGITGAFDPLTGTLTLTGLDSVDHYQAALRTVTYVSSSQDPAARTVSFQVTDGTDFSNIVSRSVGGYVQLVGTTLNVYGTPQGDLIDVDESTSLNVTFNGVVTQFTPAQVTAIKMFGYDGDDEFQIKTLASGVKLTAYGGIGNDVYVFGDTSINQIDTVVELAGEGIDALNFGFVTTAVTANLTSDSLLATTSHRLVRVGAAGQSANFETVFGGSANDFMTGNAANNALYGNGGNDTLIGGDGNDFLFGGDGNDLLKGGNQNDSLFGGLGDDYLKGEAGIDYLNGDDGFNTLVGGTGDDRYLFNPATINQIDTVVEQANEGIDTLDFSALTTAVTVNLTNDSLLAVMNHRIVWVGGAGQSANFENVIGGSANDQITGNATNNLLAGNGGNDTISGDAGNDILLGGAGNDTLKGISGQNLLIGGAGGDLLLGGTGSDLLFGGSSLYDTSLDGWQPLLAEWMQATAYQTRVDHLQGTPGGVNNGQNLNSSTAKDDTGADYLSGGAGQDWFLGNSVQDVLMDRTVDEVFTHIDGWS